LSFIQKIINFFSGTKREIKPVESITPIPEKSFEVAYRNNLNLLSAKEDAIFLKEITNKPDEKVEVHIRNYPAQLVEEVKIFG
jgi:hypothetical protein